jgi:hypothetical protein
MSFSGGIGRDHNFGGGEYEKAYCLRGNVIFLLPLEPEIPDRASGPGAVL